MLHLHRQLASLEVVVVQDICTSRTHVKTTLRALGNIVKEGQSRHGFKIGMKEENESDLSCERRCA